MRTRLSRSERRTDILETARRLIAERGLSGTEMEDIRLACGISRGGLYHHFGSKRAILDALVDAEVAPLAEALDRAERAPIAALLRAGSGHLGAGSGIVPALAAREERLDYLSGLETALTARLGGPLAEKLAGLVRRGVDPAHVAELFLTVNAHINRREILGEWSAGQAAGFAATALSALAPFLDDPSELAPVISDLKAAASP